MLHGACRENEELIDLNLQLRVMDKNARCMCGLMPIKRVSEPVKEGEIDITLHETKNNKLGRAESEMDCDIEVTQRAKKSLNTEDRKVKKRKRMFRKASLLHYEDELGKPPAVPAAS